LNEILLYALFGFAAQMIDGCLGMGYGVISTTLLLGIGVTPALASASVHTAEVFTTGVSGLAHLGFGNVDRDLLKRLLIPGIIGGVVGAYILTAFPSDLIKPLVGVYLLIMGGRIVLLAFKGAIRTTPMTRLVPLGLTGGFLDAIGGGGWGPIVTSTLVANGHTPRFAIGSVNTAEFFVTLAQALTFFAILATAPWRIVLGLMIGGVIAAPIAAKLSGRLSTKKLMIGVGITIIVLSLRTLYLSLTG
jgi:uncharacterized membrane protein YfcA